MSETPRHSRPGETWAWLHPERSLLREGLGARLWPELGPVGREQARGLLQGARDELRRAPALEASLPEAARRQSALRLLERELRRLEAPPGREELAALVADLLGPAGLARDPGLVQERLDLLEELLAPLRRHGRLHLGGERQAGARGARRLRAVARHLELRLPALLPESPRPGLDGLLALADELESLPTLDLPRLEEGWRELDEDGGWPLSLLLERVESELATLGAELERRAEVLRARYLGAGSQPGRALDWLRGQFALDPVPAEQWAWQHERHLQDISRHLRRQGLPCPPLGARQLPGLEVEWPSPGAESTGGLLALPDLSRLDPCTLEAHGAEFHHGMLPVLAAREGLPGRLWLAWRLEERAPEGPETGWLAALARPADLDAWARWACAWLPRSGWLSGDTRLRLLSRLAEWRELWLTRADLELRLGIRPREEIRRRLESDCGLPAHLAEAAWRFLEREPGRQALASARLFDLQDAGRRWRRLRKGGGADLFWLTADLALASPAWLRAQFAALPAEGRRWSPLPPALVRPASRPDLLGEVEERLAALGRIRREDLEAGREFDPPAPPLESSEDAVEPPQGREDPSAPAE